MITIIKKSFASAAAAALALCASAAVAGPNIPPWAERVSEAIYKIPAGATRMIERHGQCRSIKNNQDAPMMVPTGTASEWNSGKESFLSTIGNRANVTTCPDYFYFLQGCRLAEHGRGECLVKPASRRTLTEDQVRTNSRLPESQRPTQGCRVGSRNWGDVYYRGDASGGVYHPMGWDGDNKLHYNDYWAGGQMMLDQHGSLVLPHKNIANKLFKSTVDYSGVNQDSGRMSRMGWPDSETLSCVYTVLTSIQQGGWVDWGDYNAGGGKRAHIGNIHGGENGGDVVKFIFVRTPGVPDIITNEVIDAYMVDAPPDPPS